MHEAILYRPLQDNKVMCTACRHNCIIPQSQTGICGVRQNKNGKLFLLVYGKASAVNIDPVEKKPLHHFLPGTEIFSLGTVGCNFACTFCQNWNISQVTKNLKRDLLKKNKLDLMDIEVSNFGYELSPESVIEICISKDIKSIAYTYNEPAIFFEYLYDTSKLAREKKIKNVLVTNGYESDEALEMLKTYVDAMNIDLKSFSDEFYSKICQAKLEKVLQTIKKAHELGIWIELTTLLIPGKNDSEKELNQIAGFISSIDNSIPWHISAFHPDFKMTDIPETGRQKLLDAYKIGKRHGLKFVYVGNVLDDKHSNTYCPNCKELMISRKGYSIKIENFNKGKCQKCNESIPGVWK